MADSFKAFPAADVRLWLGAAALTLIGYFYFPGHTYLSGDSSIYVPIIEHEQNPVLLDKDIVATRPFRYSIYDQAANLLTSYAPLSLTSALELQQFVFRGCGVAGAILIGLGIGLGPAEAWFAAAVVSLGGYAPTLGATVDPEPVARAFAFGCILLATGIAIHDRPAWAGALAGLAFLYHPTTTIPFVSLMAFAALRKSVRPIALVPLLLAPLLLVLVAHSGTAPVESPNLFHRLDDAGEAAFQRFISPNIFVSEWSGREIVKLVAECIAAGLALWTLRRRASRSAIHLLSGLLLMAALAPLVSLILLEGAGFAQIQTLRATVMAPFLAALLPAACAIVESQRGRWLICAAWLAAPVLLLLEYGFLGGFRSAEQSLAAFCILVPAMTVGLRFAGGTHGIALAVAAVLPFLMLRSMGLGVPADLETPELEQVSRWARDNTLEDSMFLFADNDHRFDPGVFRATSLRAVYVDWQSRGQGNYFPGFADAWRRRWSDTRGGHWIIAAQDLSTLRTLGVDYVVMEKELSIPGLEPEFHNAKYSVYRVP